MNLSNQQVSSIRKSVEDGNIQIESLKEDVLDHLCCVVEAKMAHGKAFQVAVQEALVELAPNGLAELQQETVFLLNSNKIVRLKKILYTIGLVSAMSFASGWVCGMLHLPGASGLSIYGFLGFTFIFLPLLAISYYKVTIQRVLSEKLKFILGLASAITVALSLVFKMLHLQGAPVLLMLGATLFVFGFLPFLFFSMYKKAIS